MGLQKGCTNNPNGRPVGSKNKITSPLRKRVQDFLNDNWDNLQKDFEQLDPKDRVNFYEKLLQYGLPKLQHTEFTGEFQNKLSLNDIFPPDNDFDSLTDNQLDNIIDNVKKIPYEQITKNTLLESD